MVMFHDRNEAAALLAVRLDAHRGSRPLVLGIPRGGVPMARIVADELGGDLDVLLVRKLRAPDEPELAIGAMTESGLEFLLERPFVREIPREYVEAERQMARALLRRQREVYTPGRRPISPKGRVVIVVDDGIATGATAEAALLGLREEGAERVVLATAVAPPETADALESKADDVVCLAQPEDFRAVSQFYGEFPHVSDEEIVSALRRPPARLAG